MSVLLLQEHSHQQDTFHNSLQTVWMYRVHQTAVLITKKLTMNVTLSTTPPLKFFFSEYLTEDSNLVILGRDGSIVVNTGLGTLQPVPV